MNHANHLSTDSVAEKESKDLRCELLNSQKVLRLPAYLSARLRRQVKVHATNQDHSVSVLQKEKRKRSPLTVSEDSTGRWK